MTLSPNRNNRLNFDRSGLRLRQENILIIPDRNSEMTIISRQFLGSAEVYALTAPSEERI